MRVSLVAYTQMSVRYAMNMGARVSGYQPHPPGDGAPTDADELAEFAGRLCYQSWDRPNPATATNDGYLKNIIDHQHFSVLEHASASLYVDGVSRSFLAEITRHRHLSFSVMSQRYVDESEARFVVPPAIRELGEKLNSPRALYSWIDATRDECLEAYTLLCNTLEESGLTRKQAREAARSVLPSGTETKMLITGNLRAWREVIAKRISPHADAEMQQFAREALSVLRVIAPATFQDMS